MLEPDPAEVLLTACADALGPLSSRLHVPLIRLQQRAVPTKQIKFFVILFAGVPNKDGVQLYTVSADVLVHVANEQIAIAKGAADQGFLHTSCGIESGIQKRTET